MDYNWAGFRYQNKFQTVDRRIWDKKKKKFPFAKTKI